MSSKHSVDVRAVLLKSLGGYLERNWPDNPINYDELADKLTVALQEKHAAPKLNIRCEVRSNGNCVVGTVTLSVIRVEQEDDGSFTAVTDYWPG